MSTVFLAATGETATLTNTFKYNGTATDPSTVVLTVTDPTGVVSTYNWPTPATITRAGAGIFFRDVALTATSGTWTYLWTGTGSVPDVAAGSFDVFPVDSRLYVTPDQLKSRLGLKSTDVASDLEVLQACRAASRMVEQLTQRQFARSGSETRNVETRGRQQLRFGPFNDVLSLTAALADYDGDGVYETNLAGGYTLGGYNVSGPEPRPYTYLEPIGSAWAYRARCWPVRLQLTGVFGWPQVPAAVSEAARVLAAQVFRTKDAPLGVASFGEGGAIEVRRNPFVQDLLAPYEYPEAWY